MNTKLKPETTRQKSSGIITAAFSLFKQLILFVLSATLTFSAASDSHVEARRINVRLITRYDRLAEEHQWHLNTKLITGLYFTDFLIRFNLVWECFNTRILLYRWRVTVCKSTLKNKASKKFKLKLNFSLYVHENLNFIVPYFICNIKQSSILLVFHHFC